MTEEWQIEFYSDNEEEISPVRQFLQDAALTKGELKQLQLRLKLLQAYGLQLLIKRSDILAKIKGEDNLYELRLDNTPHNPRIFLCALTGKRLVLLHGFKKKSQKTPKREITKAIQRQKRLLEREDNQNEEEQ
ncbi:type II toxin-antitoxin system RelE/ParE family toxin [Spirulina sp. 06S082]|uniref:type II toxin-antitoxin system RelE/ParE family toxin n=1 Tax=Spirulina sp. 06S082 TaxID=3110248 RepID=UPI002B218680|nr:type II toxin-antitoxin system RelE/ParE family toxin [Spirulina sp. 06S082]MEA5470221.1 type II toxin-antitoxin system RelE/ParE family toxin [Spirulina sp. 06S082]